MRERIMSSGVRDLDHLDGHAFERYLSYLFENLGCKKVEVTKGSGDFGADIIAEKDGRRIAIQAKRYSGKVNLKAVQEIYSAKKHYSADIALVVTNNYFANSAIQLAKSTNVYLWDRNKLVHILNSLNDAKENNKRVSLVV
jgi:restriction system protein